MRVFVTGASGWIGSATVDELLGRRPRGRRAGPLRRLGGGPAGQGRRRSCAATWTTSTRCARGADDADAVVHLANKHDCRHPEESNRAERDAVETIAEALAGTDRPSCSPPAWPGSPRAGPATEADPSPPSGPDSPRGGAENLALDYVDRGVRTVSARFAPTVHGTGDHGFIAYLGRAPAAGRRRLRRRRVNGLVGGAPLRRRPAGAARPRAGARRRPPARRRRGGRPTREIAEAIGRGARRARRPRSPRRTPSGTSAGSARSSRWTCPRRAPHPGAPRLEADGADPARGHRGRRLHRRLTVAPRSGQ